MASEAEYSGDAGTFATPPPGELLVTPAFESWADLAAANAGAALDWDFDIAEVSYRDLRSSARAEAMLVARSFTSRLGGAVAVSFEGQGGLERSVVMTGHQPEFFHPGVWVKDFLVDRLARETGATGVDLVVDSDAFDALSIAAPCVRPHVQRCEATLVTADKNACYACTRAPDEETVRRFCAEVGEALATLPSAAAGGHFETFCKSLLRAGQIADSLAELVTFARRLYESSARTGYLELPVTLMGSSRSFATFAFDIALNCERFGEAYNAALDAYREATGTRSAAQPFPNLARRDGVVELPFWVLGGGRRSTMWAEPRGPSVVVHADGEVLGEYALSDAEEFRDIAAAAGFAPKALTLTLFARTFLSDLFIHGTGGARYDRVTDDVMRRYWGIEPPAYAVASLTETLPIGMHLVTEDEVSEALERANRFEHNPDTMLASAHFADPQVASRAERLAAEKAERVRAIALPDADRKTLGREIRELNAAIRDLIAPLGRELRAEVASLQARAEESTILGDRTYPFCFWDPRTIAARVR